MEKSCEEPCKSPGGECYQEEAWEEPHGQWSEDPTSDARGGKTESRVTR